MDEAVRRLFDTAYHRAAAILARNRVLLDRCAEYLLQKEILIEGELRSLTQGLHKMA